MTITIKKSLGQHFLIDHATAYRIVQLLSNENHRRTVIEVGAGSGNLTKPLIEQGLDNLYLIEIDRELILYLKMKYPYLKHQIIEADFLTLSLAEVFQEQTLTIIGNFPYNISSQIFFKILANHHIIYEVVGMVQKEVAERIAAQPGSKRYGILSVLLQAFYTIAYHFTVPPHFFHPPPKVDSAVITLHRNAVQQLACRESFFLHVVKHSFQQRRKKLRNALHHFNLTKVEDNSLLNKRAEELNVSEFIQLTQALEN